jgi:predicted transposase YbfD/YdcC
VTACDKGHGRVEVRTLLAMDVPEHLSFWPGVKQIVAMKVVKFQKSKESHAITYGITSLSAQEAPPEVLMRLWRDHWSIENKLHRTRDVVLHEDHSTIRMHAAPQVMAAVRNLAIFLARKWRRSLTDLASNYKNFPRKEFQSMLQN